MMVQRLTAKQAAFVEHMAAGVPQSEAYRRAYPDATPATVYSQAGRLSRLPHIAQEIERIQQPEQQQQAWDRARQAQQAEILSGRHTLPAAGENGQAAS